MRRDVVVRLLAVILVLTSSLAIVSAFQQRAVPSRFDAIEIPDPTFVGVRTTPIESLAASDFRRVGWESFRSAYGPGWRVVLDGRSGAPMLVEGPGIALTTDLTLENLERAARRFAAQHAPLLQARDEELVLDGDASGQVTPDVWQVVFRRSIAGVPVLGDSYVFHVSHGRLVAFGAPRWSAVASGLVPALASDEAGSLVRAYMGLESAKGVAVVEPGTLMLAPIASAGTDGVPFAGRVGEGYDSALIWRTALRVEREPGTWVAYVDARTGAIRAFFDDNRYAQVKGGVFPVSDDGICPDGCEQPGYPMPFADVTIDGMASATNSMGIFSCTPAGGTAVTHLAGTYVRVSDTCGTMSQSATCDSDLDLQQSAGTDCTVPAGSSTGNTHASRSGFYHLNRIMQKGRVWLPTNTWLQSQLLDNVNIQSTCNAYWDGASVNFYRSGGGCRNTGEIAGVFLHEYGHGLDEFDGGGYDNPSEAYADITAFMETHVSCIGRGFFETGNCSGYGNACLDCSGIRDQDWNKRANHVPSTPSGFLTSYCGGGSGPCGKETHCESYVGAETLWDLANRDLPAMGLDGPTSWQLTDRLWYKSRQGSGGNGYNCSLPSSDGCNATSWFTKLRTIDDDDGNLANGTPHAAAIFAAFNRHAIACGTASDASNQNSSACPALAAPTVTSQAGSGSAVLSWSAVPGAASYNVLRNEAGCSAGYQIAASSTSTGYTDTGLADGFPMYYAVQAVGTNAACLGPLSACQTVTPQPFAGTVALDRATYPCASTITVTVRDGNIGATSTIAKLSSSTETVPETITLTQVTPGSANYAGTIVATTGPASADGLLSVANGDTITAVYVDADDGLGGTNLARTATAGTDCVAPVISAVGAFDVTGKSARIAWTTSEASNSTVRYGTAAPPASSASNATLTNSHSVGLAGLTECTTYVYKVESADAVGNVAADDNHGAYYSFATGKNNEPEFGSTGAPVAIPDNSTTGATSSIPVAIDGTVLDVNVKVNITHTYDGDLTLSLITPTGTTIALSNRRGGGSDNFTNTVFDDEAATAISAGSAPFTGSFRPDSPLTAADGIPAAGTWRLKVVDGASLDTGTIDNWSLIITLPAQSCGPHAAYASHAAVSDTCSTGGAGSANGVWDAGETVQFSVDVRNDGTLPLTGVSATVTPATAGVTMLDGYATYADLAVGATATSIAPHFTARVPAGFTCGDLVSFDVTVSSAQGSWTGSFQHRVGTPLPGSGTALSESFTSGIPATWSIVDGGSGGSSAATWTASNPGGRTGTSPITAPFAIVDSDYAGTSATQDEQLITPVLDLHSASTVSLQFDEYFRWYSGGTDEHGDVDVRSSLTGGAWVNVRSEHGASSADPNHVTLDLTAQAAGASDVQVRFHYYNGTYEWYWQVDNVTVTYTAPAGCAMTVCASAPTAPPPVPDGSFGSAMGASRADASGTSINLTWDAGRCTAPGYHAIGGPLASLASHTVTAGTCGLGTTGSAVWTAVPAGDLWFVVVADDAAGTEGSWGTDSTGAPIGGSTPSGQCGMTARNNGGTCP